MRKRAKPMRWCPGCLGMSACHDDRSKQCGTVREVQREMRNEHATEIQRLTANANAMGTSYASTQSVLEEDLRVAVAQGLDALARERKLEDRVDQLLGANTAEVERRRELQRDVLVQETIVAALADRCVLVERKLKGS